MASSPSTARRRDTRRRIATLVALALTMGGAHAEGLMLRAQETQYGSHTGNEYALTSGHAQTTGIRLLSDYYFFDPTQANVGPTMGSLIGGLRASTGTVGLAQPMSLYDTRPDPSQNLPYIGLGYSHLIFNSQLSLNADFGLASQTHGHGLFTSASSLDDVTSQLRWAPVMAVNVRYSF